MRSRSLFFAAPGSVQVKEDDVPEPAGGEVLVGTVMSAISAGTEMLFFHDLVEKETILDTNINCLGGSFQYPFKYGYSAVGEVLSVGPNVPRVWEGQLIFSFHPHESHFVCGVDEIIPVPDSLTVVDGIFLPSMETALSLVMDGRPLFGENVVVLGQGVIGLLTTSLLSRAPLQSLVTLDKYQQRRDMSLRMGADISLEADLPVSRLLEESGLGEEKADLTFELSGNPEAMNHALQMTGFEGRIIIGSWYGRKKAELNLGESFHRNRLKVMSSQVSNIQPALAGRWDKRRRFALAWEFIKMVDPSSLITHKFDISDAQKAYDMIDEEKDKLMQVVFTYQ
jgi:2-desacetyl-2-hydroxyethyl bacteriochlorophyllide A dehydrogenase